MIVGFADYGKGTNQVIYLDLSGEARVYAPISNIRENVSIINIIFRQGLAHVIS